MALREIWDPEETTDPGMGGLADPDPLVMLGKVAGATARTGLAVRQLAARFDAIEKELRDEGRRTRRLVIIVVIAIEAVARFSPGLLPQKAGGHRGGGETSVPPPSSVRHVAAPQPVQKVAVRAERPGATSGAQCVAT